jgi:hypothetical protein
MISKWRYTNQTKYHENLFSGSRVHADRQTDVQTDWQMDMMKLTDAFHNLGHTPDQHIQPCMCLLFPSSDEQDT